MPEKPLTFQGLHRRKDGTTYPVEVTATLFQEESNRYILANVRDITERKQAEEEREKLQSQLLQAQKMESVGRLAGGVAHDLNNMLVVILGYSDMLLADKEIAGRGKKQLELMRQAGLRCRDLVSQLLAFSRKQTLKMESLDLNSLLLEFERLLQKTIREDIEIRILPCHDIPMIKADRGQLEQILLNLAINAQDAMPGGGVLSIETGVADLDEKSAARQLESTSGRFVMLMVSDTGHGMDRETREHIFEPFFTTKELGQGTGLGLATVYGIVRQHQGNIWVYSEPGEGTIFKIYLPAMDTSTQADQLAVQEVPSVVLGHETVLVVEDNDMVREFAISVLEDQGYTVLSATNGSQCLELLETHSGPLDLLLTDVIMPDMNGKDVYELVMQSYPKVKVLYMSGYTENVISSHGVLDGDVVFIQKPFTVQALAGKVREVLEKN
jgi:signal transduction histidine kinase